MSISKIATVVRSEYLRRVRTKAFILSTLLGPLLILLVMLLPVGVMILAEGGDTGQRIALVDETNELFSHVQGTLPGDIELTNRSELYPIDAMTASRLLSDSLDGILVVPSEALTGNGSVFWYSRGESGLFEQERLQEAVTTVIREQRVRLAGADEAILDAFESRIPFRRIDVSETGEEREGIARLIASSAIGYILGMFLFFAIFLYGTFVMRGVIEEKANRIVEVVVSSVRPFELMMGKVLGIGAVGITQLLAWTALLVAGAMTAGPIVAGLVGPEALEQAAETDTDLSFLQEGPSFFTDLLTPNLLVAIPFFYIGGFLLFASLFAAIGSVVEQEADAQQFVFPVTMLALIPILVMPQVIGSPNETLSVVFSLIPFTSPIIMVARMTITSVPFWQVGLSFLLLAAAFVGAIWLAARIYRVGILMYGKKASLREIFRWARRSGL